jgi:hypothetical protein
MFTPTSNLSRTDARLAGGGPRLPPPRSSLLTHTGPGPGDWGERPFCYCPPCTNEKVLTPLQLVMSILTPHKTGISSQARTSLALPILYKYRTRQRALHLVPTELPMVPRAVSCPFPTLRIVTQCAVCTASLMAHRPPSQDSAMCDVMHRRLSL